MKEKETKYTTTGYSYVPSGEEGVAKIEILIKALGTMVLKPQFEVDPTTFIKHQLQPVQEAILLDDNRKIAEDKLVELIKSL